MIKLISTFALKPGYDPEETYQLWIKEHIPYVKKMMSPELKGYVIGRVLHSLTGGEFYGAVQLSYNTLEDAKKAWSRLFNNPPDEFTKRITDIRRVIIDEKDVM
jgi:hypothetical protein